MFGFKKYFFLTVLVFVAFRTLWASKLAEMKVVDKDYLMLHFIDAEVVFKDSGKCQGAYGGHQSLDPANSRVREYGEALDLRKAANIRSWRIRSGNDSNYGTFGVSPKAVYRKSRVNGMSYTGWDEFNQDQGFDYTMEHFIYLKLPSSMKQDKMYIVEINDTIHADEKFKSQGGRPLSFHGRWRQQGLFRLRGK
jgi:endoglucanase